MAHCSVDHLTDVTSILDCIRKMEKMTEKGFGKFYLKNQAFLHFHIKGTRRWADCRDGLNWGSELDLPIDAGANETRMFVAEVSERYLRTLNSLLNDSKKM